MLLAETDLPLGQIAEVLNYSEISAAAPSGAGRVSPRRSGAAVIARVPDGHGVVRRHGSPTLSLASSRPSTIPRTAIDLVGHDQIWQDTRASWLAGKRSHDSTG